MLSNATIDKIRFEVSQIDELFEAYSELLASNLEETPDLIHKTALASFLHSFYNGVENIFEVIAKDVNFNFQEESRWHQALLKFMSTPKSDGKSFISLETFEQLNQYLAFRHFYRHSYSFHIDWSKLRVLIFPINDLWKKLKMEIMVILDVGISTKNFKFDRDEANER